MAQATISARIDSQDKQAFEKFCDNTGLNVSTAITLFVKTVIRENRIPFEIKQDSESDMFYCTSHQAHLLKSIQELHNGKGTAHELIETDDE